MLSTGLQVIKVMLGLTAALDTGNCF